MSDAIIQRSESPTFLLLYLSSTLPAHFHDADITSHFDNAQPSLRIRSKGSSRAPLPKRFVAMRAAQCPPRAFHMLKLRLVPYHPPHALDHCVAACVYCRLAAVQESRMDRLWCTEIHCLAICTLAVDDMGGRIDELEKSIGELMTQAGIEETAPAIEDK